MVDFKHTICPECDGTVVTVLEKRTRCNNCKAEYHLSKVPPLVLDVNRICVICGGKFQSITRSKTCSKKCMKVHNRNISTNVAKKSNEKKKKLKEESINRI